MRKLSTAFGRFFFACALWIGTAHAARVEVGIGVAQATPTTNGTWWQQGFPYKLGLTSPSVMVGATADINAHVSWHIDGIYLGHFTSDSWDTPNDANYSGRAPTYCNGPCLPLAHYVGAGDIFAIAALLDLHTSGDWRFGVRAGPMVFYERWSMSVPNWYPSAQTSPGQFSTGPVSPVNFNQGTWWVGGAAGVTVQHGLWGASLLTYFDNHGLPGHGADSWPPIWERQTVLMLTREF